MLDNEGWHRHISLLGRMVSLEQDLELRDIARLAAPLHRRAVQDASSTRERQPSGAFIHEMIGASWRFGGEEVQPPGQLGESNGNSFIRSLQATGVISSIDVKATQVTIHFDLSRPNAKFVSAGFDLRIPNGAGPRVDLVLSPLGTIDRSRFPAFIHCANLNP